MNDHDDLIGFLNDFNGRDGRDIVAATADDGIFLDENGEPTDKFLQALKSDIHPTSSRATTRGNQHGAGKSLVNTANHGIKHGGTSPARHSSRNKGRVYLGASDDSEEEEEEEEEEDCDYSEADDYHVSKRLNMYGAEHSSSSHPQGSKHRPNSSSSGRNKHKSSGSKRSSKKTLSASYGGNNSNTGNSSNNNRHNRSISAPRASAPARSRSPTTQRASMTAISAGVAPVSSRSVAVSSASNEAKFTNNYDTVNIEVEAEAKVKAVKLRMQGQLATIKSMEKQLADTTALLTARNKQLAHAHARLKSIEPKFSVAANNAQLTKRLMAEDARNIQIAEENVSKYKEQAELLTNKLQAETTQRKRVEEKARVMKEYADKAKITVSNLESQNAELHAQVVELNSRSQKYRKGYKDIAADAAAHKTTVGERESEIMRQQAKVERLESKLRNSQMELEHVKEELRNQKVENSALVSQVKQLLLQIEISKERDATKKAEKRMLNIDKYRLERADPRNIPANYKSSGSVSEREGRSGGYATGGGSIAGDLLHHPAPPSPPRPPYMQHPAAHSNQSSSHNNNNNNPQYYANQPHHHHPPPPFAYDAYGHNNNNNSGNGNSNGRSAHAQRLHQQQFDLAAQNAHLRRSENELDREILRETAALRSSSSSSSHPTRRSISPGPSKYGSHISSNNNNTHNIEDGEEGRPPFVVRHHPQSPARQPREEGLVLSDRDSQLADALALGAVQQSYHHDQQQQQQQQQQQTGGDNRPFRSADNKYDRYEGERYRDGPHHLNYQQHHQQQQQQYTEADAIAAGVGFSSGLSRSVFDRDDDDDDGTAGKVVASAAAAASDATSNNLNSFDKYRASPTVSSIRATAAAASTGSTVPVDGREAEIGQQQRQQQQPQQPVAVGTSTPSSRSSSSSSSQAKPPVVVTSTPQFLRDPPVHPPQPGGNGATTTPRQQQRFSDHLTPSSKQQYDRLQKIYDRITGGGKVAQVI